MIRKKFINRREEINFLEERYSKTGFEFIILTGRRRTGKSRLLEEFSKDKECIFLLCENRKFEYNLEKFNTVISQYFKIPQINLRSFRECFEFIVKTYQKEEKLIIILDEFSYLVKNLEIVAEMQGVVDEILKDKKILLILSGSSMSLMQKHLMSYASPIYGRTTGTINLQPLKLRHLFEWFPDSGLEEILKIYACCDSIPKYLEFFTGKTPEREITENFLNPNSFLFREMKQILSEELREEETYLQILEAISSGKNRVVEIANYSYMNAKDVSSYLNILMNIGFVKREYSLLEKRKRKGIYTLKDNYAKFWFRFVSRFFSEIDAGHTDNALWNFRKNFNSYMGRAFEEAINTLMHQGDIPIPFNPTLKGRWWHRDKEIDLLALNDQTKEILFAECKWQDRLNPKPVLEKLLENSQHVDWNKENRKETFALFAKSFSRKISEFEGRRVFCFDLKGLERILKGSVSNYSPI